MTSTELRATARAMVAVGILAADESVATASKRLESVGVESTAETRRAYREMLFTAPGLSRYVSGVILFDETLRQQASDGTPIPELLASEGMVPGIKVDTGAKPLAGHPEETVTEGLDGLRDRIDEYVGLGARFAKWRAVIRISARGDQLPTKACVSTNAHALARYAALCQDGGLVPIVEPEVLMDGEHSLERNSDVTAEVLRAVFAELAVQGVDLTAMVLKPNMVTSGKGAPSQAGVVDVAEATLSCLHHTVPAAVPGIAFLSGGQPAELATAHLNAINLAGPQPWQLTYSFGRALQDPALIAWSEGANVEAGQNALLHRARCNAAARRGEYTPETETIEVERV
jgi:fructose-bisphosphate aldolase class I